MTNLPININAQQPAATSKQAANAPESGDAQNSQPFGAVLARQIGTPAAKDAKVDDKPPADALAQLGTDPANIKKSAADSNKKDVTDSKKTNAIDSPTTLPTEMLAALLPQTINNSVTTNSSANAEQDKHSLVSLKTNAVANSPKDVSLQSMAFLNAGSQAKEQSFDAALTESKNHTASEMATANTATAMLQNTTASMTVPFVQPMQATVNTPVGQGKWGDEFSQKVTWIASSGKDQTAELHLNPPQLGPVDVVIKVSGDQATALFTSPHAAVRDVIEQALPRLRDMLADNGIMLGNATVSDQAARDQSQSQSGMQRASTSNDNDIRSVSPSANSAARVSQISRHNGIVDTFA